MPKCPTQGNVFICPRPSVPRRMPKWDSPAHTLTLPDASGCIGRQYIIKQLGAGAVTVACTGAQTIDGAATMVLTQFEALSVVSNGVGWDAV